MRPIKYILLVLLLPALAQADTGVAAARRDSLDPIAELYRIVYFYQNVHIGVNEQPVKRMFSFHYKETDKDTVGQTISDSVISLYVYHEKLRMYYDGNQSYTVQDSL